MSKTATLELKYYSHKVGVNIHHLGWYTKNQYDLFKQDEYKNLYEEILHVLSRNYFLMIKKIDNRAYLY